MDFGRIRNYFVYNGKIIMPKKTKNLENDTFASTIYLTHKYLCKKKLI